MTNQTITKLETARGLSPFAAGTTAPVVAEQKGAGTIRPRMVPLPQDRLATALEEFSISLESSQPMSREMLLAKYSDVADELVGCLDSLDFIRQVAPQFGDNLPSGGTDADIRGSASLGDFRILREVGRGGMGVVYEAEQLSLGRRVALKVLPFAAMLDRQQLARFKNEARAAATLDHPNIVAIHSVGVERGVHYYAMQLIEGQSLAQVVEQLKGDCPNFAQQNGTVPLLPLPWGEGGSRSEPGEGASESAIRNPKSEIDTQPIARLTTLPNFSSKEYFKTIAQLGIQAAEALDHAHQNGILHRDIKPANLLVEGGCPNLRNRGLAHFAQSAEQNVPVPFTPSSTNPPGTVPILRSPRSKMGLSPSTSENVSHLKLWITDFGLARMEQDAGMTLTGDILGTLRYMSPEQALAKRVVVDHRSDIYSLGVTLYELLTLQPAYIATDRQELLHQIAFDEPRPPRQINAHIPQNLETILLKSIEKNPADRYATSQDLADDLRRFLEDRPIVASPPSFAHRARKWAQRHIGMLMTAAVVLLLAALGTGTAAVFIASANHQARIDKAHALVSAQKALAAAEAEKLAKQAAQAREAETKAVLDFVQSRIFAAAQPAGMEGGLGRDVSLRQAVAAALPFVEEGFGDQPLVEAALRNTLGVSFMHLGEPGLASEQFQAARAIFSKHAGSGHHGTLAAMNNLAESFNALGQYAEAIQLNEQMLELRQAQLGPDHPDTLETINNLAIGYCNAGRYREALPLFEQTLALRKVKLGPEHRRTLESMNNLASVYNLMGHYADANKLYERTLELRKTVLGPHHPDTLTNMINLANSYSLLSRYDDAVEIYEQALELQKQILGLDHPHTFACLNNLAISYGRLGRYDEAHRLYLQAVEPLKSKLGPEHSLTLTLMCNLANSHRRLGQHDDAMALYNETLATQKRVLGPDHPDTLRSMTGLAISYSELGRHAEALELNEKTLSLRKSKLGADHPDTLLSMSNTARVYGDLGRNADALALHEQTLKLQKSKLGPDHPDVLDSMQCVSEQLFRLGRGAEAVPIIDECLQRASGKLVHPGLIPALMDLRLKHFQTTHDVPGCLETADRFDALQRTDVASLYQSAYFRAVCAAEIQHAEASAHHDARAREQSNLAMIWLRKAVDAGFTDAAMLKKDKSLDVLRDREDFRSLIAELERAAENTNQQPTVPLESHKPKPSKETSP